MKMNNINSLKSKEVFLFDLDGTLINSEKAFFESFKNVLYNYFNISISEKDYVKYELEQNAMLLKTLRKKFDALLTVTDLEIMNLIYQDYEKEFKKIILEPEAKENFLLLKQIENLGISLALVTTCKRYYLDILIKTLRLEDLFDIIIAREDVENLKPAPDAYIKAIEYFKKDKQKCLAVEDSKRGIDAAINSGISVVQVNNFSSIKFTDDRAIAFSSANTLLKEIKKSYFI